MGSRRWALGVAVPAHDEASTVARCVASLRAALRASGAPGWIVIVADGCSDGTADRARRALGSDGEVVECRAMSAGQARRLGTDRLLARLGTATEETWLATTDADGEVPVSWLSTQLRLAEAGADAVAGVVHLDDACDPRLVDLHSASYRLHADGTHPHVHGANLGVLAEAYLDAGGWRDLAVGEDHDLWDRLGDRGRVRLSSIESWVTTSGRCEGRAPGGFAADLAALDAAP